METQRRPPPKFSRPACGPCPTRTKSSNTFRRPRVIRPLLAIAALFLSTTTLLAQDVVKPIPPLGKPIPAADRAELEAGVAKLGQDIDTLRQQLQDKPALLALLPDIQIYHNAVRYPLTYDE